MTVWLQPRGNVDADSGNMLSIATLDEVITSSKYKNHHGLVLEVLLDVKRCAKLMDTKFA